MIISFENSVKIDSVRYPVNTDTVSCLRAIKYLEGDITEINLSNALSIFYHNYNFDLNNQEQLIKEMFNFLFKEFNDYEFKEHEKVLDVYKDFDAIWSGIYRVYHVDITEGVHWWKTLLMLADLGDTPSLVERIKIRSTKVKDIKDPKARASILAEKDTYRLTKKLTLEERNKKWAENGK